VPHRHYYSAPGHALELALRPTTRWAPFKNAPNTKDEVVCRPMTPEQLHDSIGQGSRRVRHHSTRPRYAPAQTAPSAPRKGRAA